MYPNVHTLKHKRPEKMYSLTKTYAEISCVEDEKIKISYHHANSNDLIDAGSHSMKHWSCSFS